MEIYQLRTFVVVAREGSITRAAELLFLSQPAVSAHIKSLEDELGLVLFERTPRGMSLTSAGSRLREKAEQTLAVHLEVLAEARRIKGQVCGTARLGAVRNPEAGALSLLLQRLASQCPQLEVQLSYGSSAEIAARVRRGDLDAGLFFVAEALAEELDAVELHRTGVFLAAPLGMLGDPRHPDWAELAELPWICPAPGTCCSEVAEAIFTEHGFRPRRLYGIDLESVTRTLIAGGVGVGLLHQPTALEAAREGAVELLGAGPYRPLRLVLATARARRHEPLVATLATVALGQTTVTDTGTLPRVVG
ncbi:Transcriptional regulator, LysR family protein [Thiomonas sp. CB3]|nr:Transcriptional regulator, LysR family protein [Thiomonas sp. CB3]